jgi:hypothetical protein
MYAKNENDEKKFFLKIAYVRLFCKKLFVLLQCD